MFPAVYEVDELSGIALGLSSSAQMERGPSRD